MNDVNKVNVYFRKKMTPGCSRPTHETPHQCQVQPAQYLHLNHTGIQQHLQLGHRLQTNKNKLLTQARGSKHLFKKNPNKQISTSLV